MIVQMLHFGAYQEILGVDGAKPLGLSVCMPGDTRCRRSKTPRSVCVHTWIPCSLGSRPSTFRARFHYAHAANIRSKLQMFTTVPVPCVLNGEGLEPRLDTMCVHVSL